jgi:hypothetical protein
MYGTSSRVTPPFPPLSIKGLLALTGLLGSGFFSFTCPGAEAGADLDQRFASLVQPFLDDYCLNCHDSIKPKADLDLSRFPTLESIIADEGHWRLVLERLQDGDMPPAKAKKKPSTELRQEMVSWIQTLRDREARRNAGDPGPVLARRLSNAEYDYTIRDLTGVDIRPTRSFPIDPANQAGFDNSGESLTMSPALLKKHLQAAREVAEHLVLTPDGFVFAPHPVVADTDRDKWAVFRIVDFYRRQPTDYADYFEAAWRYRYRAQLGAPEMSLAQVAVASKVSAKYLNVLWSTLTESTDQVGPIARLQAMWRELPNPKGAEETVARAGCEAMREYVLRLREQIVPEVQNLAPPAIQRGSQTLVLWKNRQMAANRRRFDPSALRFPDATPPSTSPSSEPVKPKPAAGRCSCERRQSSGRNSSSTKASTGADSRGNQERRRLVAAGGGHHGILRHLQDGPGEETRDRSGADHFRGLRSAPAVRSSLCALRRPLPGRVLYYGTRPSLSRRGKGAGKCGAAAQRRLAQHDRLLS